MTAGINAAERFMTQLTIQQHLDQASRQLAQVTDSPLLEAEILLAYVLDKPRSYLHAWPEKMISAEDEARFAECLERRSRKEPIAYITGEREFWSLDLSVSAETLIPRPETELLVELVLSLFPKKDENVKAADLGTGSGAIALALASERPTWQICAVDINQDTLEIARKNAQKFELNHISFYHGNWCTALPDFDYDVIVSNPPYLSESEWEAYKDGLMFEPKRALVSGKEGLDAIREISQEAKYRLKPGGYLIIEHGFLQGQAVRHIFAAEKYHSIHSIRDLSGQERVTVGRYGF